MAEGNPMLALERGERVLTPPAVWFQGRGDVLHNYKDAESSFPDNEPQRFVANYRKVGGEITLEYIDAERHAGHSPDLSKDGRHVRAHGGVCRQAHPAVGCACARRAISGWSGW
jgi:acetyl esterase